ncbi:MAG: aconitate hydratase [Planctomycetes bacterium]|nr:aconitate hydratase [Planctomycetota bacterium]
MPTPAARNVTQKLIAAHLVGRDDLPPPGEEVALRIDQTLAQDATGTLVMLELEAMGLERVATEVSAQYVDHNITQVDHRNADDHLFLESAARRFGVWFSRAGNGVSHPVHMERLGVPGKSLLGADSHTCAAGALGMLAIGAGGLEVALAMAGEPFHVRMPRVWGVRLEGRLPDWVSAKDVILELLRRHGVEGGLGRVIEYHGPGLAALSAMDRHVIANMGAELGATTSVFPSDEVTRAFLRQQGREQAWVGLAADPGAAYDVEEVLDLSALEPLIARPSSPGDVVAVREVEGAPIYQAYVGSSANPGYRDFAVAALMVAGRQVAPGVSFDVNPASRQALQNLVADGHIGRFIAAGARLHQAGCNGCIGMGQAPASGRNSLRTVPRNFPGRSGTKDDRVWLCSPETATAAALTGEITDPRRLPERLGLVYPRAREPERPLLNLSQLAPPLPPEAAKRVTLVKGPNIASLPELPPIGDALEVEVALKLGDDVSTDEIIPAGSRVLPFRSNVVKISEFLFEPIDPTYPARARDRRERGGHAIVAGENYGQGSSREHAALAPRFLGLQVVLARGFARIHAQNLVNFGVLPLRFAHPDDLGALAQGDVLVLRGLRRAVSSGREVRVEHRPSGRTFLALHDLSPRQVEVLLAGGLIPWIRERKGARAMAPGDLERGVALRPNG